MDKKQKKIVVGCVLGALVVVVIYLNFFMGGDIAPADTTVQDAISTSDNVVQELERQAAEAPAPKDPPPNTSTTLGGGGGLQKR